MMEERDIGNGRTLCRAKSPTGPGHVYYLKANPSGYLFIADLQQTEEDVFHQMFAWEHGKAPPPKEKVGRHLKPIFDPTGFRE